MNPWTIRCFKRAGIRIRKHTLYSRKSCSGTEIRKRIARNGKWEALVPKSVAEYIKEIKGVKRIKSLAGK